MIEAVKDVLRRTLKLGVYVHTLLVMVLYGPNLLFYHFNVGSRTADPTVQQILAGFVVLGAVGYAATFVTVVVFRLANQRGGSTGVQNVG